MVQRAERDGGAHAGVSLVLGCLGLFTCGVTSLVGLVVGIIALVRINKSNGQLGGRGLALAGAVAVASAELNAAMPTPAGLFEANVLPAVSRTPNWVMTVASSPCTLSRASAGMPLGAAMPRHAATG